MKPKLFACLALSLLPCVAAFANGGGAVRGAYVFASHTFGGHGEYHYGGSSSGASAYVGSVPYYGFGGYDGARSLYMYNSMYHSSPANSQLIGSVNTEVQTALARLGYYQGPIDGNVAPGSRTAIAISSYQRDHRMPITGGITGGLLASLTGE